MTKKFEIIEHEIVYSGFFRMEKFRLKHTLFAGGWSNEISREVFSRGCGVAVILYDPHTDQVVLIEQIRAGALIRPHRAWLVEIVAGGVEPGETTAEVAHRETLEETGCKLEALHFINEFYTTPGGVSERISLFCGKVDRMFEDNLYYEERPIIRVKSIRENKILENLNYDKLLRFDANLNMYKLSGDGSWVLVNNPDFKPVIVNTDVYIKKSPI